jgi:hypothetical protein
VSKKQTHQTTLFQSSNPVSSASERPTIKKPDTKVLADTADDAYETDEESDDGRRGGRKLFPLLLRITKPCHDVRDRSKKLVRCVASKGCRSTWGWPRDKTRILKHAAECGYLAQMEGGALVRAAIEELGRKQPGLVDQLCKKMGVAGHKRPNEDFSGTARDAPPLKRSKTEPIIPKTTETDKDAPSIHPGNQSILKYRTEGKKVLEEKANKALIEFIICCGVPPRILSAKEFKHFVNVLNGNYILPSRTQFEDSLVPSYAAAVKIVQMEYLKTCRDLMLTFDGGKLGKKKFFSVHATTVHRQSFCLELDDVSRLSQTGEYIFEVLKKVCFSQSVVENDLTKEQWVMEIGIYRWCGVSSDKAGNTDKSRRLLVELITRLLNMDDACHNLHNACKDICGLEEFKQVCALTSRRLLFTPSH